LNCPSKAQDLTTQAPRIFGRWILPGCFACLPVYAQDTQFLPEIDAHLTFNSYVRGYLQAKDDREGGDPTQFTFGPSVEFYLKPLIKLKSVTLFDLDDAKSRPLVLESGYRLITAPNTPTENRLQEAATFRFPLFAQILLADRNRVDLDWKNSSFTWRYRNKLTLERTFAIRSYHFIPYAATYQISMAPDPSQRKVTPDSLQIILKEYLGKPELKSRAPDGGPCEGETKGLLRRSAIVARNIIPVGKETDRHWEQGEDPSMLDPKLQRYGLAGKLVVADEQQRREWQKIGVRKLKPATKLTQKPIYAILSGKGVRKQTMEIFRIGVESLVTL